MSHIVRTMLVLALVLSPSLTRAEEQERNGGNQLLKECEAALSVLDRTKMKENDDNPSVKDIVDNGINSTHCYGFLEGMHVMNDIVMLVQQNTQSRWRAFCPPSEVTTGQLVRVVVKYLKDHPADLHGNSGLLTLTAFREAFPCKEGENYQEAQ